MLVPHFAGDAVRFAQADQQAVRHQSGNPPAAARLFRAAFTRPQPKRCWPRRLAQRPVHNRVACARWGGRASLVRSRKRTNTAVVAQEFRARRDYDTTHAGRGEKSPQALSSPRGSRGGRRSSVPAIIKPPSFQWVASAVSCRAVAGRLFNRDISPMTGRGADVARPGRIGRPAAP
jgi:hypothetical protein